MKIKFYAIAVAMCIAAVALAKTVMPVVTPTYTFTSAVTVPISNSDLQPSYLTAVEMSFAAPALNTFTINHVSGGVTNIILDITDTMQTLTWYVPRPLFLRDGDSLVISNTDASSATLKLSIEKYRN